MRALEPRKRVPGADPPSTPYNLLVRLLHKFSQSYTVRLCFYTFENIGSMALTLESGQKDQASSGKFAIQLPFTALPFMHIHSCRRALQGGSGSWGAKPGAGCDRPPRSFLLRLSVVQVVRAKHACGTHAGACAPRRRKRPTHAPSKPSPQTRAHCNSQIVNQIVDTS